MSFGESHLGQIRAKWGKDPILFPGVFVLILNAEGKVLLGWREQFNAWTAFGGSMELDESMTETLHREILEETGVAIKDSVFFGLASAPRHRTVYPHGDVTQGVSGLFAVHLEHDDVQMDAEHSRFEWYDMDNIPDTTTPATLALLGMYQEFRRSGVVQID